MAKMCGTLVRIWPSTPMKPRSVTATPALSAAIFLPFGLRPTATSTMSYSCGSGAATPASADSKLTLIPSGSASTPTVLVFNMMLSKRWALNFCQTLTASRSAPCIRPSIISTTSMRAPRVE